MTAAAWPTSIWTHQGTKPFANPDPRKKLVKRLGFTRADKFTEHTGERIKEGADVAQIVDSNLYKVAAGAVGVDWQKFRARLMRNEGMSDAVSKRVYVEDSKDGEKKWINRRKWEEDQSTGRFTARFTATDEAGKKIDYGDAHVSVDDGKDWHDWGKTDSGKFIELEEGEKKKLDKMQKWLKENEADVTRSGADVWDNPPSGHDYGFDNDNLWEALGIDPSKPPPQAPFLNDPATGKPLDFVGTYLAPRTSHFTIPVPDGYGFGDHPGTRSGSWVNTVMASETNQRSDMIAIPVAGHSWTEPAAAPPAITMGPNVGTFQPANPRAGHTTTMDESKYRT